MASKYYFGWDTAAGTSATAGSFITSGTSTNTMATTSSITAADVREAYDRLRDPEDQYEMEKRKRSGIWKQEMRYETGEERWTINLALLDDKLREMMLRDRRTWRMFSERPNETLDALFGRGTAQAYFTKRKDPQHNYLMHMNLNPYYTFDRTAHPSMPSPSEIRKREPLITVPKRLAFGGVSVPFKLREKAGRVVKSVIEDGGDLLGSLERDSQLWLKPHLAIIRE